MLLILNLFLTAFSQEVTQTVRGRVYDNETHMPLSGATIVIEERGRVRGTVTDRDGYFILTDVAVGRANLQVSFVGYESQSIPNLLVTSGREPELNIGLRESYYTLGEVMVTPDIEKEKSLNRMATLSARAFTVEDAQRYAGGMDDPSRLATVFAGVTPNTIDNNEIVIRGNAAKGILWRLEGVEIPAPNHLAGRFSGGGVNTMFNSNMLANSDFFTGAFPAEYGNAVSGVFDINLRNGNSRKREYSFQLGTFGIDFSAEGPFSSTSQSSYLVNYRYSTLGAVQSLVPQVTGLPAYSDLCFKIKLPVQNAGVFSLWSINGSGSLIYESEPDPGSWSTNYDSFSYDIIYRSTASGLNYRRTIGDNSYLFSSIAFTATEYSNISSFYRWDLQQVKVSDQNERDRNAVFTGFINHKFSNRHTNRTGMILKNPGYNYDVKANDNVAYSNNYNFFVSSRGYTMGTQLYTQSRFFLSENVSLNAGMHFLWHQMNRELTPEPRAGISWKVSHKQSINFAYGKHSLLEPLRIYLMDISPEGDLPPTQPNMDLRLTKSHHFILGFERSIAEGIHLRVEPYYQYLYDVPVIPDSSFSMINYNNEMFFTSELVNEGTGTNLGVDITLERFFRDDWYYMFTGSVYRSAYSGGDGIERGTLYNQNLILNLLGGKEFHLKQNNLLGVNGKFTVLGGKRHSPVDEQRSAERRYVVYDESRIYESRSKTNYYVDISVNYTINRHNHSHSLILQLKNLLLQKEFLGHAWNFAEERTEPYELALIFPYLSYKILF